MPTNVCQASSFADAKGIVGDLVHGLIGRHRAYAQQLQAFAEPCRMQAVRRKPVSAVDEVRHTQHVCSVSALLSAGQ